MSDDETPSTPSDDKKPTIDWSKSIFEGLSSGILQLPTTHRIPLWPPHEQSATLTQGQRLEALGRQLLIELGEDPDREGLSETPRRWAMWWLEFIDYEPGNTETAFERVSADQLVVVSGIRVWSLCEHHLLPFWCDITIAYIAGEKVLGLSKFARIAQQFAHRLQVQERLTQQIADEIERVTGSPDVAVLANGEHLCMTMRGIKAPARMASSMMRGQFRESHRQAELFALLRQ